MRWKIHSEREVWSSPWLSVRSLDVEQPDGDRIDYHAVRLADVAAAVVLDTRRRVLLMWRHRFLIPLADVSAMIGRREIVSGITLVGLQQALLRGSPPGGI